MIKHLSKLLISTSMFGFAVIAFAAEFPANGGELGRYLRSALNVITEVGIPILFGIGFLFFVWGMFKYFILGGADEDNRKEGKDLLIYTLAGFVLIFIFWGIINLVGTATGLEGEEYNTNLTPKAPVR